MGPRTTANRAPTSVTRTSRAGVSYPGVAFVPWLDVAAHRPKVCFTPDDPRDHRVVSGEVTCGVGGFLR